MFDNPILSTDSHKDLGLVSSTDLSWTKHYSFITSRAYRILGLIRRIFYKSYSPLIALKLYTPLVRSQFSYYTQLWRPHLLKDILSIERIQRHASKYILHDYTSSYKFRLLKLKLLPLMYFLNYRTSCLPSNLSSYQLNSLTSQITYLLTPRLRTSNKLVHPHHFNNKSRHSYFHRIPGLLGMPFQLLT